MQRQKSLDKIAKKERKREKRRKKEKRTNHVTFSDSSEYNSTGMSEIEETNGAAEEDQATIIHSDMLPSEKVSRKILTQNTYDLADSCCCLLVSQVLEEEEEERRVEAEKKKNREPPIVFKEIDVS